MNTRTIQNRFAEVLASVKLNQPAGTAAIIYSPFPDSNGDPVRTVLRDPSYGGIGSLGEPLNIAATASAILALSAPGSLLVIYKNACDDAEFGETIASPVLAVQQWTMPIEKATRDGATPAVRAGVPLGDGSERRAFHTYEDIQLAVAHMYMRAEKTATRNRVKAAHTGAGTSLGERAHKHVSHGSDSGSNLRHELLSIARPSEEPRRDRGGKKFNKPRAGAGRPKHAGERSGNRSARYSNED